MDGYTLSISRCSGGDGVEESFKAKIKRREAALDAFAVAEAYCKERGCPFSLAFWEPPCGRREGAGSLRERGLGGGFPTLPTACGSV